MTKYAPVPLSFICLQPDDTKCDDAPPIVFLHDLTEFKSSWGSIPQQVANATKRRVYVVDARNHGDSEWSDVFNFDCNVDDLLHFLDYIGAAKATLVGGHIMGGITSIKTALRAPERVEKLVVEDTHARRLSQDAVDGFAKYVRLMGEAVQEVPPDVDERTANNIIGNYFLKHSSYAESKKDQDDHQGNYHLKRKSDGRYYHSYNSKVLLEALEKSAETLMEENTGEYCGPAAFLCGEHSPVQVGEDKESIKRSFPNAEFIKIEGADHQIHHELPAEFTKEFCNIRSS